ncbi:MAG: FAD-dependent oxidoreductase [Planctomycetota bacterium]
MPKTRSCGASCTTCTKRCREQSAWNPCRHGVSRRSGPPLPPDNLYLAGDWCDTGWPATMEGAVRSGYAAAAALGADDGVEMPGVVEDVPPGAVARWLTKR